MKRKMKKRGKWFGVSVLGFILCFLHEDRIVAEDGIQPKILSVKMDGEAILVEVRVPKGLRQITLESRTRLKKGSWIPRIVQRFDGKGSMHTFRLKRDEDWEWLRVTGMERELLPSSFYQGRRFFGGPFVEPSNVFHREFEVGIATPNLDATAEPDPTDEDREVVESDIWKIDGDRMFFFNQYRGLQVIDIQNPDEPIITGTLALPASGEQMYLLDDSHIALLARDRCHYFGGDAESRLIIAKISEGIPTIVASIPISGTIVESRLVGKALYLASQSYREIQKSNEQTGKPEPQWEWGTRISSYDLRDPANPHSRQQQWIAGSGHAVYATSEYLFVATRENGRWWQSRIHIIDIASADGSFVSLSQIRPAGRIIDKFKMHVSGNIFTTISELRGNALITRLETFDLSHPLQPTRLGSVEVGRNERLHATRFDGDKAYIVTFFQIDPLWVVDLSDPAHPSISGELEVPGWSTYIEPLGDRLLSIGIDNQDGWRVAVSLFDVQNPAQPSLLSRVPLGTNHSWSEANRDEKALGFVPEADLVMVPFSAYEEGTNRSGVQLVEIVGDELILRGVIEHDTTPRRASLHKDRILSLSGKSLLTVNAADYDAPQITNHLPLSWAVDHVFVEGEFLIEVTGGKNWTNESPALRVASTSAADESLFEISLGTFGVIATSIEKGRLYVAQTDRRGDRFPEPFDSNEDHGDHEKPNFRLSIYDLSSLPQLRFLGEFVQHIQGVEWAWNAQMVFPFEDVLTLSISQNDFSIGRPGIFVDVLPFWGWSPERRFVTFQIGEAASIRLLSNYPMEADEIWNQSDIFVSDARFFMSHQASRLVENASQKKRWQQQYFLDVIDFSDPENPTQRKAVNIPGNLIGIARGGAILFTKAPHWDGQILLSNGLEWLDASAYDGVSASLIRSLPLSFRWNHSTIVHQDILYVALPETTGRLLEGEIPRETSTLTSYRLAETGHFEMIEQRDLPSPISELLVRRDFLLAQSRREIGFYILQKTGELNHLGVGTLDCLGNLSASDASAQGLWVPGGDYGISQILPNQKPN